jgi:hypothetical protein
MLLIGADEEGCGEVRKTLRASDLSRFRETQLKAVTAAIPLMPCHRAKVVDHIITLGHDERQLHGFCQSTYRFEAALVLVEGVDVGVIPEASYPEFLVSEPINCVGGAGAAAAMKEDLVHSFTP